MDFFRGKGAFSPLPINVSSQKFFLLGTFSNTFLNVYHVVMKIFHGSRPKIFMNDENLRLVQNSYKSFLGLS